MTPQGRVFNQSIARELAEYEDVVLLCGHYEGIDERALELIVTDQISIGDFVLTGGELPAMMIMDCVSRLVPGVLNNDVSADIESFHDNLLEYPQYTRPDTFMGKKVPEVLFTGHHANIEKWRREQSIIRTLAARPDLLEDANLSDQERQFLKALQEEAEKENTAAENNHTDHKK
jgi:tRNA (guanine37-N1)-methyltransferase